MGPPIVWLASESAAGLMTACVSSALPPDTAGAAIEVPFMIIWVSGYFFVMPSGATSVP